MKEKKQKILIIYKKNGNYKESLLRVTKLFIYLQYEIISKEYEEVKKLDIVSIDMCVFTSPSDLKSINISDLEYLIQIITIENVKFIGIGDINSLILYYLGYKYYTISEHELNDNQIHSTFTLDKKMIYLPSRHKTSIELEEYGCSKIDDLGLDRTDFLNILLVSPKRSMLTTNNKFEVEMFSIETLNYLGIYSNIDLFFKDSNNIDNSLIAFTALELIYTTITNMYE